MKFASIAPATVLAVLGLALAFDAVAPALADAYDIVPARMRLSYEEIDLGDGETMGLLGGGYTVTAKGPFEAGLSIYGAARGERGGFFTGGAAFEMHQRLIGRLHLDAGLFAGAGGGGSAPQGGGFMLRSHAGLSLDVSDQYIGVGYAAVDFPNGDISSQQIVVTVAHPFSLLFDDGWDRRDEVDVFEAVPDVHHRPQRQHFDAVLMIARPSAGTMNTMGRVQDGDMAMIGVAWERDLAAPWFLELSVVGSMGGAGDGYAQGMCDLGVRLPLSSSLDLVLGGGAGLAGGGKVDTGGGAVADGFAKFEQSLGRGYHIGAGAGVVGAMDGDFLASRLHVDLGYAFESPVPTGGWRVPGSQVYRTRNMRVRLVNQTEIPSSDARRKGGLEDKTINLAGLKGDVMLSRTVFVTGQVLSAYDGGAGGYAVGFAGFGAEWPRPSESAVAIAMEALIGAAGGGGIDVEGGLVAQATAGVGYRFGGATGLWLRYGRSGSIKDVPDRNVISAEFTFRFSTLMR